MTSEYFWGYHHGFNGKELVGSSEQYLLGYANGAKDAAADRALYPGRI